MGTVRCNVPNSLTSPKVFQARMEAQCDEIQRYRAAVRQNENLEISLEQAAKEWIESYAEFFNWDID